MKNGKVILILTLFIALSVIMTACGGSKNNEMTGQTGTGTETTAEPVPTEPIPTEPQRIEDYPEAIIVATDKSPEEWKAKAAYLCIDGELPQELRDKMRKGKAVFQFAPGEYLMQGPQKTIYVGSDTTVVGGYRLYQPDKLDEMLYPDPEIQAVFRTTTALPSEKECNNDQYGLMSTTSGARNVVIRDIALSGYTVLKLDTAIKTKVSNVLIHNYRGEYPNGEWCNMGYGRATASFWLFGNCRNIEITDCQIQCSSHHGLALHSGARTYLAKDITIRGTRALYCGNGMLRGSNQEEIDKSIAAMPETNGHGYVDWSVAYDLCENQSVENVLVEDCYALDGWKCGFYTEPEDTGGHIENIKLIRCRAEYNGRRALLEGSNPRVTIPRETEGSNYFFQGGYFEDCVSIEAEKVGWLLWLNRTGANKMDDGKILMVNCGDYRSPISLATDFVITDASGLHTKGFWSLEPLNYAMSLFGYSDYKLEDTILLCRSGQKKAPIKIGQMLRLQFHESRDELNSYLITQAGKHGKLRSDLTDSYIKGIVYNLADNVKTADIYRGSSLNGLTDPLAEGSGIELTRDNTTQIDVNDFIN